MYKEQRALRLLDFDDGDAGAAETDVFVAVVGHAADGVEILADDGAQAPVPVPWRMRTRCCSRRMASSMK